MNQKNKYFFKWIILVIVALTEFFILYWQDLPPGTSSSILPLRNLILSNNSLFTDGAIESNFNMLMTLFLYIGQDVKVVASLVITFVVATISISYSIEYFYKRYFLNELNILELFLVQLTLSILYTLSYYFAGGQFFGYSFFIALLPFAFTQFDKILANMSYYNSKSLILNGILLSAVSSFLVIDTRTLLYTILIIIAFSIYGILKKFTLKKFLQVTEIVSITLIFYILINIRFVISILILRTDGVHSIGDIVPVQLFIAFMSYHLIDAIVGAANWSGTYNPNYIYLGLIVFLCAFIPLLERRVKPIVIFLMVAMLLLITYAVVFAPILNYYLAQTSLYPYIVYTDVDYVFNVMYDPFFYVLFGIGLITLLIKVKKIKRIGHIIGIILVIVILLTQIAYLYPQAESIHNGNKNIPIPNGDKQVANFIYSSNPSGNVLVLANSSLESNQYLYFPNSMTVDTGWNGWLLSFPNYLMSINFPDFARAMTYLGIEYIVYNSLNFSKYSGYLSTQKGLDNVYNSGTLKVFYNSFFNPTLKSKNGFYVAYNVPQTIEYFSELNLTVPIVPFYNIENFTNLETYSRGIIYQGKNYQNIYALFANTSDSYTINLGQMDINEAPYGWHIAPIIFLGDQVNALYESDPFSPVPLSVSVNVPKGEYYVYVQGGVSTTNQFGSAIDGLNISSGNKTVTAIFNETEYAPSTDESFAGLLNVTNINLNITPTVESSTYESFISKITLIPVSAMGSIKNQVISYKTDKQFINYNYTSNLSSKTNVKNLINQIVEKNVSVKTSCVIVDFTHENMGLWTYEQAININGEFFSSSYYYGANNLYITKSIDPKIVYFNSNGTVLIYYNLIIDLAITIFYLYIKKKGAV